MHGMIPALASDALLVFLSAALLMNIVLMSFPPSHATRRVVTARQHYPQLS